MNNKSNWKDQIETPIDNLIDDVIYNKTKDALSNITFSSSVQFCIKIWPLTLIGGFVSWLISLIVISTSPSSDFSSSWMWLGIGAFAGLVISIVTKSNMVDKARNQLDHVKLFSAISENVPNVSLDHYSQGAYSKFVNGPIRTRNIPKDAKFIAIDSYVYDGKINNNAFELITSHWRWVRKHDDKYVTYDEYACGIIVQNDKCNEYNVIITDGHSVSGEYSRKQELENDPFNDVFNVYGDPIIVRKLLNATEQEKLLLLQSKFKGFQINMANGLFIMTFKEPSGFMYPRITLTHSAVNIDAVVKDANRDFIELLNILSNYTCLRKIIY